MARFAIKIEKEWRQPEVLPKKYKFYKQIIKSLFTSTYDIKNSTNMTTLPDPSKPPRMPGEKIYMTTLPDPSKPPRMPREIMNYKKRRYEVLADDEQGTVKRQHIGPTQRQVSYLKFLCGKHGKKIPDFRHLSKKKVSNLIDMLVKKKDLKKWPYGDALPDSIASMTNRSHKIDKMYEWWTKKCADTMKPFDNKAVELLKKNLNASGNLQIFLRLV